MTALQRELLRTGILSAMEASGAYTLTVPVLQGCLRSCGYPRAAAGELEAELVYLRDKGLVEKAEKVLAPENSGWRITAAGHDHLAMDGAA